MKRAHRFHPRLVRWTSSVCLLCARYSEEAPIMREPAREAQSKSSIARICAFAALAYLAGYLEE